MIRGLVQVGIVEQTELRLGLGLEQVGRLQADALQLICREIAAPLSQVGRYVAEDVHQLQPLPETHAIGKQARVI